MFVIWSAGLIICLSDRLSVCLYVRTSVSMHACMYACMHICVCMFVCSHTRVFSFVRSVLSSLLSFLTCFSLSFFLSFFLPLFIHPTYPCPCVNRCFERSVLGERTMTCFVDAVKEVSNLIRPGAMLKEVHSRLVNLLTFKTSPIYFGHCRTMRCKSAAQISGL